MTAVVNCRSWGTRAARRGNFEPRAKAVCSKCGRKTAVDAVEYGVCTSCLYPNRHKSLGHREEGVVVLKSPHDQLRPGAGFGVKEFLAGLADGIWPLGTVVRMRGQLWAVCGDGKAYREPAEKLPAEALRAV